ncbi:ATP-grasp domain-containing protein [Bradyrhizobium sp.]|uniref:ATP-grasp domain-containing protein n=1 Tax=Bradyrhizobium sp. TaxID=376 RepID=UPI003C37F564
MISSERIFVNAVKKYCASHDIGVEIKSQGWLIVMRRGDRRRFAFGYDLGLNSAVAHRIANDKAATAELLTIRGVACVPHTLFLSPKLYPYIKPGTAWQDMLDLLRANAAGIVVKPNEGTGGDLVFRVRSEPELERAVHAIFSSEKSLAVSPYLEIEDEVRVVLIDDLPIVVYRKERPSITGDGKRSFLELAVASIPTGQLSTLLPVIIGDLDKAALDQVPPDGERHNLNWRHNLGAGARPMLLDQGVTRDACVEIAREAAGSIGLRFGSVDVVRVDQSWRVLEINSGVMMEALSEAHPDLVDAVYRMALDKVFQ